MFYGYIDIRKNNLKRNYQKFFVKTIDNKYFLVDNVLKNKSLELNDLNLKNVGIIKWFYLPKNNKLKNISYDETSYWESKVIYEDNNRYIFEGVNEKKFNYEFLKYYRINNNNIKYN